MGETYSCTFANCDKVFSKAYELRKHKATHDRPDSVFYCSECDFITLQKKNLVIHFALHTGERAHRCPDTISFNGSSGPLVHETRCEYRTNDPAALSRHRKKVHGYVPSPNRTRTAKAAPDTLHKPSQKKDTKVSRCCRRSQRPVPMSRRKLPCVLRKVNSFSNFVSTCGETSKHPITLLRQSDVDGDTMHADCYEQTDYDSSYATLVCSDEEMGLDILQDPSLRSQWMSTYEEGYGTFNATGMTNLPKPLHTVFLPAPVSVDVQTGREGCLCPEWMVEARVEGWDQTDLGTRKEYTMLDA